MSDPYADWDAAYVLGALSSAERREYEDHVDGCARCAAAVAELGMLPGLLRLVPDGAAYLEPAEPAEPTEPAEPVRPLRRRRALLAGLAAAVLLLGGVTTGVLLGRSSPGPAAQTVALAGVRPSPLVASVSLTPRTWGTEIALTCTYAGEYGARARYTLDVVDAAGHHQLVSRWQAGPGDTARTTGTTDLAPASITRIELRDASGRVLMARSL